MNPTCGCCEGTEVLTPAPTANRPGLDALSYRAGTHATFLETMKARLSSLALDISTGEYDPLGNPVTQSVLPLVGLTTREASDPSIALLDGWAMVADVLTFYQERIANEGYLRTATERRSILELARMIGYTLRPGVAATVYLAYTIDEDLSVTPPKPIKTVIPAGSRVQSVPGTGELPQSFETSDPLEARSEWNNLKPRLTRPQNITLVNAQEIANIYFEGAALNLKANDHLLLVFGEEIGAQVVRVVEGAEPKFDENRTDVTLQAVPFLIIAALALLRVGKTALDTQIPLLEKDQSKSAVVKRVEEVNDFVLKGIENLALGNYPPIDQEYFSHERIYSFLATLVNPTPAMAKTIRPFTPLFATKARASTKRRKTAAVAPPPPEESNGTPWTDPQVLEVAKSVLDAATEMLKDASFRHDLTCLAISVVEGLRPISSSDRTTLSSLLDRYLTSRLEKQFKDQLQQQQAGPIGDLLKGVFKLLNDLSQLVSAAELHDSIDGLLSDLLALTDENSAKFIKRAQDWLAKIPKGDSAQCEAATPITISLANLIEPLAKHASLHPANSTQLGRTAAQGFTRTADNLPQLLVAFKPSLSETLYAAWRNASVDSALLPLQSVHVLRLVASPFGYNAPVKMALAPNTSDTKQEFPFVAEPDGDWTPSEAGDESSTVLYLDAAYDAIRPKSYAVIQNKSAGYLAARVDSALIRPRTAYNVSAKTTELALPRHWWDPANDLMGKLRETAVYAQSEELVLAEEPYTAEIQDAVIELGELYDGLSSGRWLIVFGERTDIPGTSGVKAGELVMLAGVEQKYTDLPGDKTHTFITLQNKLEYHYKRDTVVIFGNVVKATHGETRNEVLGNGDGSKAAQAFTLKQAPLTFVAAPNPAGVDSTLVVRVNDIQWHETDSLAGLLPTDRSFITKTDDDGKTTVIFGNGQHGARLPTGQENVKAIYRNGIGEPGDVKADQITLLVTRPLGVKAVTNPLLASGGADRESRDQARQNAPLAVAALDRLVSTRDYADFARTFAGIGKASAARLSDGRRQLVHVTIAGTNDIPIDETSDLYRNLRKALRDFGDPYLPIRVGLRELLALIISANVSVLPDYQWESVEPKIRTTLLDVFGFQRRELGQTVFLSEVIRAIQQVDGVAYVDVDLLSSISEAELSSPDLEKKLEQLAATTTPESYLLVHLAETVGPPRMAGYQILPRNGIFPAQLAFLTPDVPDTLILKEVPQ
ncbi:MAG TPA: putative baseplate assembly protein [Candidatus Udaeobacter sp.]|nr:putative baseplate assembly protein [Candidatus Udaeobacter sp.]